MDLERLFTLALSSDGLKATLSLAERSSAPASQGVTARALLDAVTKVAASRGIVESMDAFAFDGAVSAWLRSGKRREVVVYKGRAPVNGADGVVTLFRPRPAGQRGDAHDSPHDGSHDPHEASRAMKRDATRVDRRNQGYVLNAEEGTILARVTLPTRGVAGATVKGGEIRATDGKPAAVAINDGVRVEERPDELVYRAALTGIVRELSPQRIDVGTSIELMRDVDGATGNIDAWGSVHVRGSVEAGFSVRARGDVTIDGTCESAFIQSGGEVRIGGGLLGRSGLTEVKGSGNVTALFVENATIESGGDVVIKDAVINSRILAMGTIDVGGRGAVHASHLAASRAVSAATYGSEARLPVELVVGTDPLAWRRLARMRGALRFMRRRGMKGAQARRSSADARAVVRRARADADRQATVRRAAEQAQAMVARQERALRASLLDGGGPRVVIRETAFPKTRVRLGHHVFEVTTPLGGGELRFDPERGEIVFAPAQTGPARGDVTRDLTSRTTRERR